MNDLRTPRWLAYVLVALALWGLATCVSDLMQRGASTPAAEQFQQTEIVTLYRGTLADWNAPTVTNYQRAMVARMIALEVYPNAQGRGLDDLERRMVSCIDRAGVRYPPTQRLRMVALAECSAS